MSVPTIGAVVTRSRQQTVALLFRPFRWATWFRLLLILGLAGQSSGGNLGGAGDDRDEESDAAVEREVEVPAAPGPGERAAEELQPAPLRDDTRREGRGARSVQPVTYATVEGWLARVRTFLTSARGLVLVAAGALGLVGLSGLLSWLWGRFNFVLLAVLTTGPVRIIEPFRRYRGPGNALGWWGFWISWAGLVGLVAGALWWGRVLLVDYARTPDVPIGKFLLGHWPALLGGVVVLGTAGLALVLLGQILTDVVVPIMFRRSIGVGAAWREAFRVIARRPGMVLGYWGLKFALWVVLMLGLMVAAAAMLLVIMVGAVLIGVGLASAPTDLGRGMLQVMAAILGGQAVVTMTLGVSLLEVPAGVFFRYLALNYLGRFDARYREGDRL